MRKRSNPDYEYRYFIFKPVFTVAGNEDIETLSIGTIDNTNYFTFARDYERSWESMEFESIQDALRFLRKAFRWKYKDYKNDKPLVNQDLITDLYINQVEYNDRETYEVVGGEKIDDKDEFSLYLKFVAYIGYTPFKISDD